MADLKISQLPAITSTQDADVMPIVDSGVTSKITVANLRSSLGSNSFVYNEVPSGTVDGSNAAFDTASTYIAGSISVFRDGQLMKGGGADYTETDSNTITFTTAPVSGSVLLVNYEHAVSNAGNADTVDTFHAVDYGDASGKIQIEYGGWKKINATLAYSSADDPTYVVTTSADLTGIIGVGMRIKFTNNSTTFYGLVTKIDASTMTLYGGTDYDVANSAITAPFYSERKAPLGFPLDPTKWSVLVTDVSRRTKTSPANATWYNIDASGQIVVPIGTWNIYYALTIGGAVASGGIDHEVTLSTANNSESDSTLTGYHFVPTSPMQLFITKQGIVVAASKTTYYLNGLSNSTATSIYWVNENAKMIIRATSSYL